MVKPNDRTMKVIKTVNNYVPAFSDIFDEEGWYIFVSCFVALTIVVFFMLAKYVKLKPVDW